jgi:hypothetical protein
MKREGTELEPPTENKTANVQTPLTRKMLHRLPSGKSFREGDRSPMAPYSHPPSGSLLDSWRLPRLEKKEDPPK